MAQKNHDERMCWMKLLTGCACLALSATGMGQVMQPPGTFPHAHRQHSQAAAQTAAPTAAPAATPAPAKTASQPAPAPVPTVAPSLFDQPAQPAKVSLDAGNLAIQADNSSLAEILRQVSTASGMTVDGLTQNDHAHEQRIFGNYGPGDPHAVLAALLDGSGYNVMMLGQTATGTPRQLTLTPRGATAGGASGGPNRIAPPVQEDDSEDEVQPQPPPDPQPATTAPATPAPQNGVRTPQQMLQELQQMRQQQQQQQQQQDQQQAPPQ
jgi:hypothetical protein